MAAYVLFSKAYFLCFFFLQTYLNQFSFGSSTYSDLWDHLQKVSRRFGLRDFRYAKWSFGQHSGTPCCVSALQLNTELPVWSFVCSTYYIHTYIHFVCTGLGKSIFRFSGFFSAFQKHASWCIGYSKFPHHMPWNGLWIHHCPDYFLAKNKSS